MEVPLLMKHNPSPILLAAGLVLAACSGNPSTATPTKTSTPVIPTMAPLILATPPGDIHLGDVTEKGGYLLSALAVENPAPLPPDITLEAGKKLVAVQVVAGNRSGPRVNINILALSLQDEAGNSYPPSLGMHNDELGSMYLDPGEKLRGWAAYVVPQAAEPAGVTLSLELSAPPYFRIGIRPQPAGRSPSGTIFSRVRPQLAPVGTAVEGNGYALTVLSVEDPTTPGPLFPLLVGHKLLAAEVRIDNLSGAALLVSPLYFTLVDADGFVYAPAIRARDGEIATIELAAWQNAQGWVAFLVPDGTSLESLKVVPSEVSDFVLQSGLAK